MTFVPCRDRHGGTARVQRNHGLVAVGLRIRPLADEPRQVKWREGIAPARAVCQLPLLAAASAG